MFLSFFQVFKDTFGVGQGAIERAVIFARDPLPRERGADRDASLQVVSDRREDGGETLILHFGGQEPEDAECGYLRLKQRRYLARENDYVFI